MSYRRLDVKQLVDESRKNPDSFTFEATVITGFENAAMDECREKCSPLLICRAQGRIYFNILKENFEKVQKLRSVDNLFIVNDALGSVDLSKEKEADIEVIKDLVHKVNWEETLKTWSEIVKFQGILFPTNADLIEAKKVATPDKNGNISDSENETAKTDLLGDGDKIIETNIDKSDTQVENNDTLCEDFSKLNLLKEENLDKGDNLNVSSFPKEKVRRESESSEEVYFSAEEEPKSTQVNKPSKNKKNNKKPKEKKDVGPNLGIVKFRATCNRVGEHSFSSMEAAASFGGALNDKFNWVVDLNNFDLNVILNIHEDRFYVCSAITNHSMHRRNITHFGYVTLRSTMCYNLVRLAEPIRGEIILDPLCGGGSISIEGSLGFPLTYHICGDNDQKAMNRTLANVTHLQKTSQNLMIDPIQWSARKLPLKDSSIDVCVTDLPFGKRSGRKADNLPLYQDVLSEMARVSRCGTARAVLITHDKRSFTKALSGSNNTYWRQIRTVSVNQGGLFSTAYLLLRTSRPFLL